MYRYFNVCTSLFKFIFDKNNLSIFSKNVMKLTFLEKKGYKSLFAMSFFIFKSYSYVIYCNRSNILKNYL